MAKIISPLAPSIPPATAIQDPAARRFAQAAADVLRTLQSEGGAVELLSRAAESMSRGGNTGTPPAIADWLYKSELYATLRRRIEAIDVAAKQLVLAEAAARQTAIDTINEALAEIEGTAEYDPGTTYTAGDIIRYDGSLYRAKSETTGNPPTNATYWEKIGEYASLGDAVAALALDVSDHETRITATESGLETEATQRSTLAAQLRGGYTGTDVNAVTQGLLFSERSARASADTAITTTLNAQIARIGDAEAAITSEATTRASADLALTSELETVSSAVGSAQAAVVAEQTTRATNDNALMQAINTAWAITGATQAVTQSGSNLITNWTAAQANYWTQLDAQVFTSGGQTIRAALSQEVTVRASETGHLFGQYSIKVDLNGYVTGFGLSSTANNGTPTSQFIVLANRFAVVTPGGTPMAPFVVDGTVTYIDNAKIRKGNAFDLTIGNEIKSDNHVAGASGFRIQRNGSAEFRNVTVRGDVMASSLQAGVAMVGTLHIQGNAVTVPVVSSAGASSGGTRTIASAYINPEGGEVSVIGSVTGVHQPIYDDTPMVIGYTIYLLSVSITAPSGAVLASALSGGAVTVVGKSSETGTYSLRVSPTGTPFASADVAGATLLLIGSKR